MDVNGSCSSWEWDAIGIISSHQSWYDLLLLALCRTISTVCLACGQPWLLRILFLHVATSERHRRSNIEQHAKDHDNPKQVSSLGGPWFTWPWRWLSSYRHWVYGKSAGHRRFFLHEMRGLPYIHGDPLRLTSICLPFWRCGMPCPIRRTWRKKRL